MSLFADIPGDIICLEVIKMENISSAITKSKDIAYRMTHEPPTGCVVCPETDGSYTVLSPDCTVEVRVCFDPYDPAAPYAFTIDRRGVMYANSFDEVRNCITTIVQKKLEKQKRSPLAAPSIHRILDYHRQGVPMAFITPVSHDRNSAEQHRCRLQMKQDLDNRVRVFGFGYHHVRGDLAEDERFFIVYGKPNKKSEQLLKKIAIELGQKYRQPLIGFSDLAGNIYRISTAPGGDKIHDAHSDIKKGIADYCTGIAGDTDSVFPVDALHVSKSYEPKAKFNSTSRILRIRNAFFRYCDECWDETSQAYQFDHRYHDYF